MIAEDYEKSINDHHGIYGPSAGEGGMAFDPEITI